MKILCPKCNAGKEIGYQSRFNVFACDSCHHQFRGVHAEIAKWNRLAKQLFTFDGSTRITSHTACPHCSGLTPVCRSEEGCHCQMCGQHIRTSRVMSLSEDESMELRKMFQTAEMTPEKERQLRNWLDNHDWHPRDRGTFVHLLNQAVLHMKRPAIPTPVVPTPTVVAPPPMVIPKRTPRHLITEPPESELDHLYDKFMDEFYANEEKEIAAAEAKAGIKPSKPPTPVAVKSPTPTPTVNPGERSTTKKNRAAAMLDRGC